MSLTEGNGQVRLGCRGEGSQAGDRAASLGPGREGWGLMFTGRGQTKVGNAECNLHMIHVV